jgi:hypothetical protein
MKKENASMYHYNIKKVKKKQTLLLIFVLFCSGLMAQNTGKSKSLKPAHFQKTVAIKVADKTRSYYSLSSDKACTISLQGPGKLKVITRGQLRAGEMNTAGYVILYALDGGAQKSAAMSAVKQSAKAAYLDAALGVPGQLKSFEITLGRGSHSIEFKLKDSKTSVAARYVFTPTKGKKMDWIAYSPMLPSEPVDLVSREATVGYYRFSMEKPLKVEINGPSELKVLTRTENHFQMKGRIHYRIQVQESGAVINTYLLSSNRSETTVYKENKAMIPGKACEFVIVVPKGRHTYVITPLDQDKSTLLGRLLIPKKDVKLEK